MARWWRTDGEHGDAVEASDAQTLEDMPIGLIELDTSWTIRYVNAAAESMLAGNASQ